eukprot:366479-Chlamydomonas_euryale.AAC.1
MKQSIRIVFQVVCMQMCRKQGKGSSYVDSSRGGASGVDARKAGRRVWTRGKGGRRVWTRGKGERQVWTRGKGGAGCGRKERGAPDVDRHLGSISKRLLRVLLHANFEWPAGPAEVAIAMQPQGALTHQACASPTHALVLRMHQSPSSPPHRGIADMCRATASANCSLSTPSAPTI